MNLNTEIVDCYLAGKNIDRFKNHWIYSSIGQGELKEKNIFKKPVIENMDNIQKLYDEVKSCLIDFQPFNKELWNILFENWKSVLENVDIYLTVGIPEPNDATVIKSPSGNNVIVLDLGCWTKYLNHTDITKLTRNLVTHECCHMCIQTHNPIIDIDYESGSYLEKFNSLIFNEGFAHLLSFCEDINNYDWNDNKINEVRSKSLTKLKKAVAEIDRKNQNSYLYDAMFGSYYDKFGCMVGMLYLLDIYKQSKSKGLLDEYKNGHKNIISRILNFYL